MQDSGVESNNLYNHEWFGETEHRTIIHHNARNKEDSKYEIQRRLTEILFHTIYNSVLPKDEMDSKNNWIRF